MFATMMIPLAIDLFLAKNYKIGYDSGSPEYSGTNENQRK